MRLLSAVISLFSLALSSISAQTSPGNCSINKSTQVRVESKHLHGRWRLHLMGSWLLLFNKWYNVAWRFERKYFLMQEPSLPSLYIHHKITQFNSRKHRSIQDSQCIGRPFFLKLKVEILLICGVKPECRILSISFASEICAEKFVSIKWHTCNTFDICLF